MREGEVLAEKYRIGSTLGAGAMGVVVAARHLLLDQEVAIKFLVPRAHEHPSSIARFMREARATARIKSEHVVRVLDVDVLEGGVPYIVMELLEGCDLAEWLRRRRSLRADEACDIILQACDAVHEAHGLDIIHRDLKPPNLFVVHPGTAAQTVKVLDFGISKVSDVVPPTVGLDEWKDRRLVTEDRMPIGSPHYMSPEQMESARDVDARTDVWALGVTLYELVTGRLPFEGTSLLQVYSRINAETPEHLRTALGSVAPGVADVIVRCLERSRERRFRTVAELAMALVAYGSERAPGYVERIARSGPRPVSVPSDATPNVRDLPPPRVEKTLPSPVAGPPATAKGEPRTTPRRMMLAAAGLAVLAIAVWASASRRAPDAVRPTPKPTIEAAAPSSMVRLTPDVASVTDWPGPPAVDAAGAPTIASLASPEVAKPTRSPVRPPPAGPLPVDSTRASAPATSSAPPQTTPSTRASARATDGEWVPPDVPK